MQLAIGGHLKQSKWVDRATSVQREALRVRATSQGVHALCSSSFCHSAARCEQGLHLLTFAIPSPPVFHSCHLHRW